MRGSNRRTADPGRVHPDELTKRGAARPGALAAVDEIVRVATVPEANGPPGGSRTGRKSPVSESLAVDNGVHGEADRIGGRLPESTNERSVSHARYNL